MNTTSVCLTAETKVKATTYNRDLIAGIEICLSIALLCTNANVNGKHYQK